MGFVRSRCFKLSLRAIPKLPMKYRSPSPPWPVPKRGKARNHGKRPSSSMAVSQKKNFKAMPYVRGPKIQNKFRKERNHYGVSIERLASMQPRQLIHKLTKDGILPAWNGSTCLQPWKVALLQGKKALGPLLLPQRVSKADTIT